MRKKKQRTYIGGQAVIEGVMMRSKSGMATCVREESGALQLEAKRLTPPEKQKKWMRLPFIRGVVSFISSLVLGMSSLMRSSEVYGSEEEEQPSKFTKWLAEHWKISLGGVLSVVSTVIGVALAVILFLFLPNYFAALISNAAPAVGDAGSLWYNLIEGGFRFVIFILYILFTLIFPMMRETYRYHGAEHKTINCYEYGDELTPENVKKASRLHDRCGTTFLFIVLIISIVVFALAVVLTRYVSLGSVLGACSVPVTLLANGFSALCLILTLLTLLIIIMKHMGNISRIIKKREPRFVFRRDLSHKLDEDNFDRR